MELKMNIFLVCIVKHSSTKSWSTTWRHNSESFYLFNEFIEQSTYVLYQVQSSAFFKEFSLGGGEGKTGKKAERKI